MSDDKWDGPFEDLGDLCKYYEENETLRAAFPQSPIIARLDGRAFHTFTKGMNRPYDPIMTDAMIETTKFLIEKTHALVGYTQSDEISLAWYLAPDKRMQGAKYLFDGRYQKLVSVLAGMASSKFMQIMLFSEKYTQRTIDLVPAFDCRVFQVPDLETAAKVFIWRQRDATKNSISMAAQSVFSHKELDGKNGKDKIQMMQQKGIEWYAYPHSFRFGTYLRRRVCMRTLTETELERIPEGRRPTGPIERSVIEPIMMMPTEVNNAAEYLFLDAKPDYKNHVLTSPGVSVTITDNANGNLATTE